MIPQQQPIQQQYGAPGGEIKQSIEVPKAVVGKIIGKGGETITLIQRKSSAKVTVDQSVPDGMPCKVTLLLNLESDFRKGIVVKIISYFSGRNNNIVDFILHKIYIKLFGFRMGSNFYLHFYEGDHVWECSVLGSGHPDDQ